MVEWILIWSPQRRCCMLPRHKQHYSQKPTSQHSEDEQEGLIKIYGHQVNAYDYSPSMNIDDNMNLDYLNARQRGHYSRERGREEEAMTHVESSKSKFTECKRTLTSFVRYYKISAAFAPAVIDLQLVVYDNGV